MSFPKYFQDFKNIKYAVSTNKAGMPTYINIKDFFHLMRVKDDILKEASLYTEYYIENNERPENVSYKVYGDEQFYWVILQVNDIVDYYNQWPLSSMELETYILKKYGSWNQAGLTHHWETVETFDDNGNLVLPGGVVVHKDYIFYYPNIPGSGPDVVELSSLPVPISNTEYEQRINEAKRNIVILNDRYIIDYIREVSTYALRLEPQSSDVSIADNFR
jgi:hypothetical protein